MFSNTHFSTLSVRLPNISIYSCITLLNIDKDPVVQYEVVSKSERELKPNHRPPYSNFSFSWGNFLAPSQTHVVE